ncbi:hypothetical protein [Clostridium sp.]|uniref:hypothetical protein n=1 Tax=Clostridium sp. TaxID=1506 RepID=UPI002FCB6A78
MNKKPQPKKGTTKKVNKRKKLLKKRHIRIIARSTILLLIITGLFLSGYIITTSVIKYINSSKVEEKKEIEGNIILDNATDITVNGLLNSVINRSYKTIEGDEELKFYSTEGKKILKENKTKEKAINYYKLNELEQRIIDRKIKKSYYEGDKLIVEANITVETTHGNEDYITYVEPIGAKNEMTLRIVMIKESDENKVQYYYTLDSKGIEDDKK